jgi:hypothetical protein
MIHVISTFIGITEVTMMFNKCLEQHLVALCLARKELQ